MIYTVTFNPAIDYVVRMDNMELGTVNRNDTEAIYYGGKGINVSILLNNLGRASVALGFVAGFTGNEIEQGLQKQGIDTEFIHLKNGLSRINVKIKAKEETEVNGQGPKIDQVELKELYEKLDKLEAGDVLVLAGAIPKTMPEDTYEQIMLRMKDKNVMIVVDATKNLLLNVVKYHPFLIKPNNHELGEMFGVMLEGEDDIVKYAKQLQDMGARNVLVSMAGDGSILITEQGQVIKMGVPKGTVVNSVGAGDSMVAGFIFGYEKSKDYQEALRYGTAAGSATAFSEGLGSREKIEELYQKL